MYDSFYSFLNKIEIQNGLGAFLYVSVRPKAIFFLRKMSEIYEIFIFTASAPEYAIPLIKLLDP